MWTLALIARTLHDMRVEVGVRELRENLSDWLDRAAAGEEILVTERGKPKAMLSAAENASFAAVEASVMACGTRAASSRETSSLPASSSRVSAPERGASRTAATPPTRAPPAKAKNRPLPPDPRWSLTLVPTFLTAVGCS